MSNVVYSLGTAFSPPAGPFLNKLGSPSSITKVVPVNRELGISISAPVSPVFVVGCPGRLSNGPGVLHPNTILGVSRLALLVVVPLIWSFANPALSKTLQASILQGFKNCVGSAPIASSVFLLYSPTGLCFV